MKVPYENIPDAGQPEHLYQERLAANIALDAAHARAGAAIWHGWNGEGLPVATKPFPGQPVGLNTGSTAATGTMPPGTTGPAPVFPGQKGSPGSPVGNPVMVGRDGFGGVAGVTNQAGGSYPTNDVNQTGQVQSQATGVYSNNPATPQTQPGVARTTGGLAARTAKPTVTVNGVKQG
jgi:hypothetical protein